MLDVLSGRIIVARQLRVLYVLSGRIIVPLAAEPAGSRSRVILLGRWRQWCVFAVLGRRRRHRSGLERCGRPEEAPGS